MRKRDWGLGRESRTHPRKKREDGATSFLSGDVWASLQETFRLSPGFALGSLESGFGRHANGFKPAADKHLGVGFATEMPGGGATGGSHIPLDDRELLISALDHKPMDRILTDDPANLALEFLQIRHAFSVERWLGNG
jgi:hypothetical protein